MVYTYSKSRIFLYNINDMHDDDRAPCPVCVFPVVHDDRKKLEHENKTSILRLVSSFNLSNESEIVCFFHFRRCILLPSADEKMKVQYCQNTSNMT